MPWESLSGTPRSSPSRTGERPIVRRKWQTCQVHANYPWKLSSRRGTFNYCRFPVKVAENSGIPR